VHCQSAARGVAAVADLQIRSSEYGVLGLSLSFEFYELGVIVYVRLGLQVEHELFNCFNALLMAHILRYASVVTGAGKTSV
jgi:hypothetical protein